MSQARSNTSELHDRLEEWGRVWIDQGQEKLDGLSGPKNGLSKSILLELHDAFKIRSIRSGQYFQDLEFRPDLTVPI